MNFNFKINKINPHLLTVIYFTVGFCSLYYLGYVFKLFDKFPANDNIIIWDAAHYHSIAFDGYIDVWYENANTAFFPLFPLAWRLLSFTPLQISILNFLVYIVSVLWLGKEFKLSNKHILIFLSLPSNFFFCLPFTESFFFFFCTIFLVGYKRNSMLLIVLGLLLSSMVRGTAMFFVPAIIVTQLITEKKFFIKESILKILLYISVSIAGLYAVVLYQYKETGVWFAFARQQINFWGHRFALPGFPLTSHSEQFSHFIDCIAFAFAFLAFVFLTKLLFDRLFKKGNELFTDKVFVFSLAYLTATLFYALFFNPKALMAQTGVDSLNRYVFCTVFAFIFLTKISEYVKLTTTLNVIFIASIILVFVAFGLGGSTLLFLKEIFEMEHANIIYFVIAFVYLGLIYRAVFGENQVALSSLIALNMFVGVVFLYKFICGAWIA